ncbi:hypothetical protein [Fusobacterium sp. PH5-44]|uniref:hypothetical protein n=1 Tax=unclassified Fusobacterium TaxID=2648384 RepID=UPI003D1FE378
MRWIIKKISEDKSKIMIAYSFDTNYSCDGIIEYNKEKEEFTINKMSEGATEGFTKWLFQHLWSFVDGRRELTEKPRVIAIG